MQIVPRLATLGRVELMMTRPADGGNRRQLPQLSQIEMQEQNDPAFCLHAARQQRIYSSGRLKGIKWWLPRLADDGFEEGDSFKRVFFDGWAKRVSLESGCLDGQPAERKNGGAFWRGPDR
jgi:hypothetical protein